MLGRLALAAVPAVVALAAALPPAHADDHVECRITDPRLSEISGLAFSHRNEGVLWVHNDSGDGAKLYALDASNCDVLGVLRLDGVPGTDIEAIAAGVNAEGDSVLWVGDIGDNTGKRASISLYEVPETSALSGHVAVTRYLLRYSQAQDAEALLADPASQRLWIISKGILGGSLFQVPLPLTQKFPSGLRKIGEESGFVTDAAVSPDGSRYVVRDYTEARIYDGLPPGPLLERVTLPKQVQGEAVTWTPDGRALLIASESDDRLLRVDLPKDAWMASAAGTPATATTTSPSASPSAQKTKVPEPAKENPLDKAVEPVDQLGQIAVIALAIGAVTFVAATIVVVLILVVRERRQSP